MGAIAKAVIAQRTGSFDPTTYRDRYQEALREVIEAKMKGLTVKPTEIAATPPVHRSHGRSWASADPNLKSPPAAQRYARVYRHRANTSWRGSHGSAFLLLRLEPLHRAGLGHVLNRLWLAALCGGRCLLFVEFVDVPTFDLRVEHFQGSAAGVDLIVMCEIGEAFENTEQFFVP